MHVAVIGGGLAGLAASYDLVRAGHRVTLIEGAATFGGLASSVRLEGHPVERFYHFICRGDRHLRALVRELGLEARLHWHHTRTAFFHEGQTYRFGSPLDLLRFSAIPPLQRLRFGLHVMRSRYRRQWRELDGISAERWLVENVGEEAYRVIWYPLLKVKFGAYCDQISAAWIWHRVWRVARSRRHLLARETFGCLEHGTATLVDPLVDWLRQRPTADLRSGVRAGPLDVVDGRVRAVPIGEERLACDAVISTVAMPTLARLCPGRPEPYFANVRSIEYIGVVCMLLSLTRPFSENFWTNINDPRVSFNGIIEQTNLNQELRRAGVHVLYVPFYVATSEPRYSATPEALLAEYVAALRVLNPEFSESWVKEWHVFREPFAQPIFTTGFAERMPAHRTPVRGLYVTDSTQFYPEDRTISSAIEQGRTAAAMVLADGAAR